MAMIGRLTVAMLMACCVTGLMIGIWAAFVWALHPHWVFAVLFILWMLGLHFFVVRRSYLFVKEHWF